MSNLDKSINYLGLYVTGDRQVNVGMCSTPLTDVKPCQCLKWELWHVSKNTQVLLEKLGRGCCGRADLALSDWSNVEGVVIRCDNDDTHHSPSPLIRLTQATLSCDPSVPTVRGVIDSMWINQGYDTWMRTMLTILSEVTYCRPFISCIVTVFHKICNMF